MKGLYIKALLHAMYYTYERFLCGSDRTAYDAFACFQILRSQLAEYVGVDKAYLYGEHITHLASMKQWGFYKHSVDLLHHSINRKQTAFEL